MKKRIMLALVGALIAASVFGGVASADNLGPCTDSGGPGHSDYAKHHIAFLAKMGKIGNSPTGVHVPGTVHQGFSACNPSGK